MGLLPPHPMHAFHTGRPVDARWHRITDLADCGQAASDELDDRWIRRGLRFLRRMRASSTQSDRERLAHEMPDLYAAYRLRMCSDKMERVVVEARLLARQSLDEVAAACNLSVKAVTAYEAIFFQVIGRLNAFLFILPNAVGVNLAGTGLKEDDCDILLKLFAYKRGPLFMELALRYFHNGVRVPERLDQASRADLDDLAMMLQLRGLVLATVLPHQKVRRATLWSDLAEEVATYAVSRGTPALTPITYPDSALAYYLGSGVDNALAPKDQCSAASRSNGESDPPPWWTAIKEAMRAA